MRFPSFLIFCICDLCFIFVISWKIEVYDILRNNKILENRVFGLKKILEKALFHPGKSLNILELDPRAGLAALISIPSSGIYTFRYLIAIPILGNNTSFETKVSIPAIPDITIFYNNRDVAS